MIDRAEKGSIAGGAAAIMPSGLKNAEGRRVLSGLR
jgi:hypothetical protein